MAVGRYMRFFWGEVERGDEYGKGAADVDETERGQVRNGKGTDMQRGWDELGQKWGEMNEGGTGGLQETGRGRKGWG